MPVTHDTEAVEPPDAYPMTLTEWSKLHRLLAIGHTKLVPPDSSAYRPEGIFERRHEVVMRFDPPVKASVNGQGASASKGEITHACLSMKGLDLWFKPEGVRQQRVVKVTDVASVEQVL